MSTTCPEPSPTSPADLLILVHGTYAARESVEGGSWWQNGSPVSTELTSRLPNDVRTPAGDEVFRWSGENSERARIMAGRKLLAHLQSFEQRGQGYHLVGHSHGGSVIWHALQLATSHRKALDHLRSWATVGTPFLQHRTRGFLTPVNLFNLLLAVLLIKPALTVLQAIGHLLGNSLSGTESDLVTEFTAHPVSISLWSTPVLRFADMLGMHVSASSQGVQIGSFNSASGQTFGSFLLTTPQGWLLLGLALLVVYVYVNLAGLFVGPILETLQHHGERNLRTATMRRYALRWLGIWSREDEAINGLRATLNLSMSFVSKMVPRERVLLSDSLALLSRPYYWLLSPVFNRFLRPLLDNIVRAFVVKTAQGNNRPSAQVIEVSPTPVLPELSAAWQPLPEWLDSKIVDTANLCARDIAPKLRRLMAAPCFTSGLESLGDTLSGRELVHTSYFDHPEVLDLLTMHMGCARGDALWHSYRKTQHADLVAWLDAFHEINRRVAGEQPTDRRQRPFTGHPIRPRRRTRLAPHHQSFKTDAA
jgi:hypothetical protein